MPITRDPALFRRGTAIPGASDLTRSDSTSADWGRRWPSGAGSVPGLVGREAPRHLQRAAPGGKGATRRSARATQIGAVVGCATARSAGGGKIAGYSRGTGNFLDCSR
jgi:hypothetical protein